jgi:hypothetical protein
MVRFSRFFVVLAGAAPVWSLPILDDFLDSPIVGNPSDAIEAWRTRNYTCPLWSGTLPTGVQKSTCIYDAMKNYTRGGTTARVYKVPGAWTGRPHEAEVFNGLVEASRKALDIFGSFVSGSLTINVGVLGNLPGEPVQAKFPTSSSLSKCYILVGFPSGGWEADITLRTLQKDFVKTMYHCLQHRVHPDLPISSTGTNWWRQGTARYFDGLAYPTSDAMFQDKHNGPFTWGTYSLWPEHYHGLTTLHQTLLPSAVFWHYADGNAGWTTRQVHDWMVRHRVSTPLADERASLAGDSSITSIFHGFMLAFQDRRIKYPTGQTANFGPPRSDEHPDFVNLERNADTVSRFTVEPFKHYRRLFKIAGGQRVRFSVQVGAGMEWSITKSSGTSVWNSGDRGRTFNIETGENSVEYMLVATSTRNDDQETSFEVRMKRID